VVVRASAFLLEALHHVEVFASVPLMVLVVLGSQVSRERDRQTDASSAKVEPCGTEEGEEEEGERVHGASGNDALKRGLGWGDGERRLE